MSESLLPTDIVALAERVITENRAAGRRVALAESCTGGLVSAALTEVAGSSTVLDRGFVTYSNEAKSELLGVDPALIAAHGAVSDAVAQAMAAGAVAHSRAQVALSVTGVAGPTGGSPDKPVGTVWFGWQVNGQVRTERRRFDGDRATVRAATVEHALRTLVQLLHAPAR